MFRILALFLAIVLLIGPSSTAAPKSNRDLIALAKSSLVLLQSSNPANPDEGSTCTAFVIDTWKGLALTAEHCVEDGWPLLADGFPSEVVKKDDMFALVTVPPGIKPSLALAPTLPTIGEEVVGIGYGLGNFTFVPRTVAAIIQEDVLVDDMFTPGQSGGPLLNREGQVVGLIQMNVPMPIPTLGVACGSPELKAFLGR